MEIRAYTEYNEAEILDLYASVGWTAYTDDPAALRNGFANSLLTLAAYEEAELAGLIRVVGDGHTVVFVQDILVRPQFQRRGSGSASGCPGSIFQCAADRACHRRYTENHGVLPVNGLPGADRARLPRIYENLKAQRRRE